MGVICFYQNVIIGAVGRFGGAWDRQKTGRMGCWIWQAGGDFVF
jgi:hypothetical protein